RTKMSNINVNIECHHRRGLFYYTNPWLWGSPCRRCRRLMSRGVVVVQTPTSGCVSAQVAMPPGRGATTTTANVVPAQTANNWQQQQQFQQQPPFQQQQQMASALPPKYEQAIAAP
ncbi:hypothetical protein KR074_005115, partial [Drosophila pseudoananassae]